MPKSWLAGALLASLLVFSLNLSAEEATRTDAAHEITVGDADWPWWRGPRRNGISASGQNVPQHWSETENVLWSAPVPGRGHGSPTVVGDQVFLACAELERQVQSVLCIDRRTGEQLWQAEVHAGGLEGKGNEKTSLASCTVACDGQRVFVNFLNGGAIYTTALDRQGMKLWQTKVTDYILHQGFGSSPAIYHDLVIVSADNKGTGLIVALDRASGKLVWKQPRPQFPNYTSPIILEVGERDQLLFTGCNLVSSFAPLTGEKLWEIEGSTTECVTSTVADGDLIFTSGGYPKNHMSAVRADGSGTVVWENATRVYVPSLLARGGYLYGVQDAGIATCWKCDSGEEVWKGRLSGTFSASPVMVDDVIYATNEEGHTFLFSATPQAFQLLAENQLGDEVLSTPTICGSRIYIRLARNGAQRAEYLYCLGKE